MHRGHQHLALFSLISLLTPPVCLGLPNPTTSSTQVTPIISRPIYSGVPTSTKAVSWTQSSVWNVPFIWFSSGRTDVWNMTETTLQPGPFPTTALPSTITQWVVSTIAYGRLISAAIFNQSNTWSTTWATTVPETIALHKPMATHLPAGATVDDLPCNTCPRDTNPDPICEARGLQTGCQGQCDLRDGVFWCMQTRRTKTDGIIGLGYLQDHQRSMGRACWGGNLEYRQLLTPCQTGDFKLGCTPCQGRNDSYRAMNWDGPGSDYTLYLGAPYPQAAHTAEGI